MTQQVSDLGWVDYGLGVPLILPNRFAHSAYLPSAEAESAKIKVNPNQVRNLLCHHGLIMIFDHQMKISLLRENMI